MNKLNHLLNLAKNYLVVSLGRGEKFNKEKMLPKWYCPIQPKERSVEPTVTWIGQATFLIQIDGINILTDPHFFDTSILYKRLIPPGIHLKKLPPIDVVVISHNHIDHMDKRSLLAIKDHKPIILAPHGDGQWFYKRRFEKVFENRWGNKHSITGKSGKKIVFTYLPAAHWSGRYFLDFNRSTCGSWMIESDLHNFYFAGDSSYDKHFLEISQEFKSIQTAIMPIGPVEPRSSVEHAHLDGKEAVQAFIDLNAKQFIPMHWGTFQFGAEQFEKPLIVLQEKWTELREKLLDKKLLILRFGKGEIIK